MGNPGSDLEPLCHLRAAEVEVAVLEALILGVVRVAEVNRERGRLIDDIELLCLDLNLAGRHLLVGLVLRTASDRALHLNAVLVAEFLRLCYKLWVLRIEADLDNSPAVAHVNENEPAEIAALLNPAEQMHGSADIGLPEIATVVSTHNSS